MIVIRLSGNICRIVFGILPNFEEFVRYKIRDNLIYLYILGQVSNELKICYTSLSFRLIIGEMMMQYILLKIFLLKILESKDH